MTSVSVTILNYRRRENLARVLDSVRAQTYPIAEVIVIDNASGDGTPEWVQEHYPEVRLLTLADNAGSAGRNRGVEAASGELVVMLDNDVSFSTAYEVSNVVAAFARHSEATCLMFKVVDAAGEVHKRDWCHPRPYETCRDRTFETWYITEGACAFRREEFLRLGGYWAPLWIGAEGWDLALRILAVGGKMFYEPTVCVRHEMAAETRTSWRPYYFYTRNYFWIVARNYPLVRGAKFLLEKLAMLAFFAVRTGNVAAFLRGIADGLGGMTAAWQTRRRLPPDRWMELRYIGRYRPSLWSRLARHRQKPLI